MAKPRPKLTVRARDRIEGLEKHITACDVLTGNLEKITDHTIQLSIDQALRSLADTRRWLTDAIECVRIDHGLTASGEAPIETGVST